MVQLPFEHSAAAQKSSSAININFTYLNPLPAFAFRAHKKITFSMLSALFSVWHGTRGFNNWKSIERCRSNTTTGAWEGDSLLRVETINSKSYDLVLLRQHLRPLMRKAPATTTLIDNSKLQSTWSVMNQILKRKAKHGNVLERSEIPQNLWCKKLKRKSHIVESLPANGI